MYFSHVGTACVLKVVLGKDGMTLIQCDRHFPLLIKSPKLNDFAPVDGEQIVEGGKEVQAVCRDLSAGCLSHVCCGMGCSLII